MPKRFIPPLRSCTAAHATAALIFLWQGLSSPPALSAEEGEPAPEFDLTLFSGSKLTLKDLSGKVIILHFWASWCESCKTEMPVLEHYFKVHHADGLRLVAISMDKKEDEPKAREIMKEYTFEAAFARNSSYRHYGRIWRLPLTFVIDRKGILRKDGWVLKHLLSGADLDQVVGPLL